jgi:hypothetical protein
MPNPSGRRRACKFAGLVSPVIFAATIADISCKEVGSSACDEEGHLGGVDGRAESRTRKASENEHGSRPPYTLECCPLLSCPESCILALRLVCGLYFVVVVHDPGSTIKQ